MNHMERLQGAAPAVPEPMLDRSAVFTGIVARPGDARLTDAGRGRPVGRRLAIVLVILGLLTLTAAGLAGGAKILGWHDEQSLITKPQQWQALYRTATRQLTLPPGQTWPTRTLAPHTVTGMSQPGGEAVAISRVRWECYWGGAIRSGDTAAQARAQAALADINANHTLVAPDGSSENVAPPTNLNGPFEIFADDGGIQYVKKMYAAAAAGRPKLLFQSCRANS
jgi:hypothetical protein